MTRRRLVLSKSFQKSFKKFIAKNPSLKLLIESALIKLEENAFLPELKTHKLSGNLFGLYACSCGYNLQSNFFN